MPLEIRQRAGNLKLNKNGSLLMIHREFVQKYLEVKEMLENDDITESAYKKSILDLCYEYKVDPKKLAEYNMDLEPRKFGKYSRN